MHAMEAKTAMASTGSVLPIRGEALAVARDGRALLDRVTVEIGPGAGVTALIGPNGAGKSLLIRTLAGLIVPDSGTVAWHDRAPGRDRMRRIGFVFQRPVMLRRSVLENILFPLTLAGAGAREARERARAELDLVGLRPIADAFARNLSGGEQQRVALARAMVTSPEVLFLDEATANLDPASTAMIEARLKAAAAAGLSVVLVTQDLKQARRLATSIVMMHKGRVLEHTHASTFFAKPRTTEAQRFLDGALLIDDDGGTDEGFDT
jgi:tungstate transport system ATP-binding protein